MTKIYLVTIVDETGVPYNMQAFTNCKKAKAYQRYWNAKFKNSNGMWEKDEAKLTSLNINHLNYEKYAVEEEMKNLPY